MYALIPGESSQRDRQAHRTGIGQRQAGMGQRNKVAAFGRRRIREIDLPQANEDHPRRGILGQGEGRLQAHRLSKRLPRRSEPHQGKVILFMVDRVTPTYIQ